MGHSRSLAPGGSGAQGAAERGRRQGMALRLSPAFCRTGGHASQHESESWCYRRSDNSCGDVRVSLMGFVLDISSWWPCEKNSLGFSLFLFPFFLVLISLVLPYTVQLVNLIPSFAPSLLKVFLNKLLPLLPFSSCPEFLSLTSSAFS